MMFDPNQLTHFIIDVDGTMTDSGIYFDNNGNELKRFSSRDFAGILAAHYIGIEVLVVTGRECPATLKRAKELHIDHVYQNIKDKRKFIQGYMEGHEIKKQNLGYIGDDLNDYAAMQYAGFVACPSDACKEVRNISSYISSVKGGQGVIQDVFRWLLGEMDRWEGFLKDVVDDGY